MPSINITNNTNLLRFKGETQIGTVGKLHSINQVQQWALRSRRIRRMTKTGGNAENSWNKDSKGSLEIERGQPKKVHQLEMGLEIKKMRSDVRWLKTKIRLYFFTKYWHFFTEYRLLKISMPTFSQRIDTWKCQYYFQSSHPMNFHGLPPDLTR